MTQIQKLIQKLKSNPTDMTWNELRKVLSHFGFKEYVGKGSRRKFMDDNAKTLYIHEPHPTKILKHYQIKEVIKMLEL